MWCDRTALEVHDHTARVDLHFNVWCDLPDSPDVLDIGFLFKEARPIHQLYLYIPGRVKLENVQDLSEILQDDKTLSAVFNDTLFVGSVGEQSFEARRGDQIALHVMRIDRVHHITVEELVESSGTGTVIRFGSDLFAQMRNVGDHYVRIRIKLQDDLGDLFSYTFQPDDRIFLSAFYNTQVIEFRLNEKRNFSEQLKHRYPKMDMPRIGAVHYFLVRHIGTELVRAHAELRKIRRLEPLLWVSYLRPLGNISPDRMVIYHWRDIAPDRSSLDDFIALAWFRTPRNNVVLYLLAILLLGASGSSLQALLTKATANSSGETATQQGIILAGVLIVLSAIYYVASRGWPKLSRARPRQHPGA